MKEVNFKAIVAISADSPAELRRCDVWRVVDAAFNARCLSGFCDWLRAERPDIAGLVDKEEAYVKSMTDD